MSIEQTISQIVTSVFPSNAEIHTNQQIGSFHADICWNLNNDPDRPNKQSKTIILNISDEVLKDIPNLSPDDQSQAMNKISTYLQGKLREFEPDHDAQHGVPSPSETWVITTDIAGLTS